MPTAICQDVVVRVTARGETKNGQTDPAAAKLAYTGVKVVKGLRYEAKKGASAEVRIELKDGAWKRYLYLQLNFDVNKQLTGVWSFDRSTWTKGLPFHGTFSAIAGPGKPVAFDKLPKPSCEMRCDGTYGWGQAKKNGPVYLSRSNSRHTCLAECAAARRASRSKSP